MSNRDIDENKDKVEELTKKLKSVSYHDDYVDEVMAEIPKMLSQAEIRGRVDALERILGHWHYGSHPSPERVMELAERDLTKLKGQLDES